ncbi:MAG: hypothetical protein AB7S81_04390 [Bdellovibrionales bacterium]
MSIANSSPLERLRDCDWSEIADVALIPSIAGEIDRLMMDELTKDESAPVAERLFDILMTRFDVMAPYKKGLTSMAQNARHNKDTALALWPALRPSMSLCLREAGLIPSLITEHALLAGYVYIFSIWEKDITPDSAPTMAALNRIIQTGVKAGFLGAPPQDNP